jgi:hypothetical protein
MSCADRERRPSPSADFVSTALGVTDLALDFLAGLSEGFSLADFFSSAFASTAYDLARVDAFFGVFASLVSSGKAALAVLF